MAKKYDLRTEKEKLHDKQNEQIKKMYEELLPYAPYPMRAMTIIAAKVGVSVQTVKNRLVKMGMYETFPHTGRNGARRV